MTNPSPMPDRAHRARPYDGVSEFQSDAASARWVLRLSPDEPVFQGHYPGHPILPGIYTLESIQQGVERFYVERGARARLRGVKSMRFLATLGPGDLMQVGVELPAVADGRVLAAATVHREGMKAAVAKLVFDVQDDAA